MPIWCYLLALFNNLAPKKRWPSEVKNLLNVKFYIFFFKEKGVPDIFIQVDLDPDQATQKFADPKFYIFFFKEKGVPDIFIQVDLDPDQATQKFADP